jgi:hypothetical protein
MACPKSISISTITYGKPNLSSVDNFTVTSLTVSFIAASAISLACSAVLRKIVNSFFQGFALERISDKD